MINTRHRSIEERRAEDPGMICEMPSGLLYMGKSQYLRGYCILRSDPVVGSINNLNETQRARFLLDMTLVGDAILEVTGAYRMNYFIAGNFDPLLHAHIVPRYLSEPDQYRKGLPWLYPGFDDETAKFVFERDAPLMRDIEKTIQKYLQNRSKEDRERIST